MESNKSRGTRTLFWMKATLALSAVMGVMVILAMHLASIDGFAMKSPAASSVDADVAMNMMFYFLGLSFLGFLFFISWCVYQIFWLSWMFRATRNLRAVATTAFSPWGAVICSALPYAGLLIHYFIFKNLVKQTEDALNARRQSSSRTAAEILSKVQVVDKNFVNGFAIMALLAGSIGFIRETSISGILTVVFSLISVVCYMKSFAAFIKEEQALFEIYQDEQIRAKVDQVLWERKLESEAKNASTENPVENK